MKNIIAFFSRLHIAKAFLLLMVLVSCNNSKDKAVDQHQAKTGINEKFEVSRGTNIAHWLSQSNKRGEERASFFTKNDIERIAEMGFDHIRLPIDEEQMWDEDGNRYQEAFDLMVKCVEWCEESNLKIIVDLHILRSHHFNAEVKPLWTDPAEQEKFFDLWRDLSKSLNRFSNGLLAYELMNEAVADNHESWNNLISRAVNAIRELEEYRTIVIGSNRWQSVDTFDALRVPLNDENILLSFHFYKPFLLSHYAAEWTDLKDFNGAINYPGVILTQEEFDILPENIKPQVQEWVNVEFTKASLLEMWQQPINKAKIHGLPLYCGEFGIISNAPKQDGLNWYKDMIALFEETGIGYANWNYKSDNFGLFYSNGEENTELTEIVISKP